MTVGSGVGVGSGIFMDLRSEMLNTFRWLAFREAEESSEVSGNFPLNVR